MLPSKKNASYRTYFVFCFSPFITHIRQVGKKKNNGALPYLFNCRGALHAVMYPNAGAPSSVRRSVSSFPVSCLSRLVLPRNRLAHESLGADVSHQIGRIPPRGKDGAGKDLWMLTFCGFCQIFFCHCSDPCSPSNNMIMSFSPHACQH